MRVNITSRYAYIALVLIGFVSPLFILPHVAHGKTASIKRPNIVFLLADDMNRDTWGVYGSKDCQTPNIDRLANDGVRFTRAYCSVAMCAPFRQELYSGRSPWRTKTLPNHSKSTPDTKSIAHYLKPLGYRVALIGKTHIGPKTCYPFEYHADKGKATDQNPLYINKARSIMDECTKSRRPFCIFVASNDGHGPYTTGNPHAYKAEKLTIPPYWLDTPEVRQTLVKYYAEVTNFDKLVGQMRAELEKRGLWDNTIFMVCSEQGTSLPFAKWTCYDNGLHTGLVTHWSGGKKSGFVAEELISMADVTPTLVEAAGGKLKPGDCDGKSFLKAIQGEDTVLHKYVYGAFSNCNLLGNPVPDRIYPIRVIRSSSYSLIFNPNHKKTTSNTTLNKALAMTKDPTKTGTGIACSWVALSRKDASAVPIVKKLHHRPEYELYDLNSDPYELNNLINDPAHKAAAKELKMQLHKKLAELGDQDPIATEEKLSHKKRKK